MIICNEPLSIPEVGEYVENAGLNNSDIALFIKKFQKLDVKDAKELKKSLFGLNSLKLKLEHISKIIDILPETKEELNKITGNVSLDEDESKKILDEIKKFK